jgi:hypothetical protein
MSPRWLSLSLLCLVFASAEAREAPQPTFEDLLAKVKKSDPKVDFAALRMAYTKTARYNPYASERKDRDAMRAAVTKEQYAKALELAEKVLKTNYLDIDAHFVATRACAELKKPDQAKFHRYVVDGLIGSILKSGDGKTFKTAFVVIATDEEYVILTVLGVRKTSQALLRDKGQKYDRIDGTHEKTKKRVTLYFNVTRQLTWLEEQFKKKK